MAARSEHRYLIVGDRIAAVGTDLDGDARAREARLIDCGDRLVIPGFVNAHTHSNESFEQGFYDALPLEVWLLWKYPPLAIPRLPERVHYLRTLLLGIESVRSGITTVQDDLINQLADPCAFDGSAAAYRDLGLRANLTTSMGDQPALASLPWTDELMDPGLRSELAGIPRAGWRDLIALFERNSARWHGAGDGRIRVILGPIGPQWCSTDLLKAGVPIGLGTDGTSTSDRADMFRSLGMAAMLHRLADLGYDTWIDADDAFEFAAIGAARTAMLHDDIGVIEPGRKADLALIDRNDYGLIPLKRPLSQLAYGVNSEAVRSVIVDGKLVMSERVLKTIDEPAVKAEIREEAERYLRDHVPQMEACARRFEPYFRAAHLRASPARFPRHDRRFACRADV